MTKDSTTPSQAESNQHSFYKKYGSKAETLKIFIEMIIGILIVICVCLFLYKYGSDLINCQVDIQCSDIHNKFYKNLSGMIAVGLLAATGIQLAYMLYTDGPDEAVNPPILAVGAAILLRLPTSTTENGLQNALEIAVLIFVLVSLLAVREIFLPQEPKTARDSIFRKWLQARYETTSIILGNLSQAVDEDPVP